MTKDSEERRAEHIKKLELLADEAERDADKLRAIDQLFRAEGWLAPEQKEITTFESTFIADLDLDEDEDEAESSSSKVLRVDFGSNFNALDDED
jgi:hypothetical protein